MENRKYKYLVKVEWSIQDLVYKTHSLIESITLQKFRLEKSPEKQIDEYGSKIFFDLNDAKKYIKELKKNYKYNPPKIKDVQGLL